MHEELFVLSMSGYLHHHLKCRVSDGIKQMMSVLVVCKGPICAKMWKWVIRRGLLGRGGLGSSIRVSRQGGLGSSVRSRGGCESPFRVSGRLVREDDFQSDLLGGDVPFNSM